VFLNFVFMRMTSPYDLCDTFEFYGTPTGSSGDEVGMKLAAQEEAIKGRDFFLLFVQMLVF